MTTYILWTCLVQCSIIWVWEPGFLMTSVYPSLAAAICSNKIWVQHSLIAGSHCPRHHTMIPPQLRLSIFIVPFHFPTAVTSILLDPTIEDRPTHLLLGKKSCLAASFNKTPGNYDIDSCSRWHWMIFFQNLTWDNIRIQQHSNWNQLDIWHILTYGYLEFLTDPLRDTQLPRWMLSRERKRVSRPWIQGSGI